MEEKNRVIFDYLEKKFRQYHEKYPKYDIFGEKHFKQGVEMFKDSMLEIDEIKKIIDEQLEKMLEDYKKYEERDKEIASAIEQNKRPKEEIITELVTSFAKLANIQDEKLVNDLISKLNKLNNDDIIDYVLVSLNDRYKAGNITMEDIFSKADLIMQLNPQRYKTNEDLISRLNWIKTMNMEHTEMPLTKNHRLVIETFDKFNGLLQGRFDCYYTGGLMGYLATNQPLERYHSDLDLFINETQLEALKQLIDASGDFEFVSNMDHKEINGHEYKVTYKGTPMSIGLFLFEREQDNSITTKEYYYKDKNVSGQLFVDEHHCTKEYTDLSFSNQLMYYNGTPYRMMSLASIYNSKKNSRPKDKYDASKIEGYVNKLDDYKIDVAKKSNYDVKAKRVSNTVIHSIQNTMNNGQNNLTSQTSSVHL